MTDIANRVKNGADWLDRRFPGWAEQVNLTELDMAHGKFCVLAQVGRANGVGTYFTDIREYLTITAEASNELGFDSLRGDEYFALMLEWKYVIAQRLHGRPTTKHKIELTLEQLGALLKEAAAEGIRVAPTAGDYTDSGIAARVLAEHGHITF